MWSITKIIEQNGGPDAMRPGDILCIARAGRYTLEIERGETGPNGHPVWIVSAHHPFSGGIVRAVELHAEVTPDGWLPFFFRNEEKREELAVYVVRGARHLVGINLELMRDLNQRMADWDRHLLEAGYVETDWEPEYHPLFPKAAGGEE